MAYYFGDALSDIRKIKGKKDGHLDMSTLPAFARKTITRKDKDGKKITEDCRDIGAMVSMLTKAVQELTERIEVLENRKVL
jgi:hypothetical protein